MVTLTLYRQYPLWVQGSVSLMGRKDSEDRCEERVWESSEREGKNTEMSQSTPTPKAGDS